MEKDPAAEAPGGARVWAAAALLAALVVALMLRRIAEFPAVHVDEAWTGHFARNILQQGVFTPHEMNNYTGPLYPWLLARSFSWFGTSVASMRLPGALLNVAALLLMAGHLGRRFGSRSALAWLLLFASSAMFVLKSRLGWEVYALQPLLLTLVLVASRRLLELGDRTALNAALFLAAVLVGVQNHFIFISVPLSLSAGSLAALLLYRDGAFREFLLLSASALLMTTVFFLVKRPMSDAFWLSHKTGLLLLFWIGPVAFAGLYRWLSIACARRPDAAWGHPLWSKPLLAKGTRLVLAAGLLLFFLFHWPALIQIWSGTVVLMRLTSLDPPAWVLVPLYAGAAALLSTMFWYMLSRLEPARYRELGPYEKLVLLWPLAYAAAFPLLRNTTSIRYYIIPSWLFLSALAVLLPRLEPLRRPRFLVPLACAALAMHGWFWRESGPMPERKPVRFRLGSHREMSWHFARKDEVYRLMESEGACRLTDREPSIDLPLYFYQDCHRIACRPGRTLATHYCEYCAQPPYVRGTVR